ncbi:MAG: SLC13 family permease, partial [Myxococcales bacterium]
EVMRLEHLGAPESARRDVEEPLYAEVVVPPNSRYDGVDLRAAHLVDELQVEIIALHRHPAIQGLGPELRLPQALFASRPTRLPISAGDVLVVRGARRSIERLARSTDLILLEDLRLPPAPRRRRPLLAGGIVLTAIVVGASGLLPLSVAGLLGVLLMLLTGCLDVARAFRIDWRIVLLIGSMLALGTAMQTSGAGELLGGMAARLSDYGGPRAVLLILMVITVVLSIPMSNQAAALVMLPVAISAAAQLDVNPRAFAIAVALAASCSFMTPLEPSCIMVYGPGNYRFSDFLRVGGPLTLALLLALALLVPLVWRL